MAEYTPGPWEWDAGVIPPDGPGRYADIYITAEDGEPIILAEFNDSLPEGRANARVIAAAPELLEAAQEALRALHSANAYIAGKTGTSNQHRNDTIAQLEAAIAKATDGEG